jgi:hypothetical protein
MEYIFYENTPLYDEENYGINEIPPTRGRISPPTVTQNKKNCYSYWTRLNPNYRWELVHG